MMKPFFLILLFFCIVQSHAQKLVYKSNGNILNSENQQISPDQVRELLKDNQKLLTTYNAGRSKKTVGNVLLIGGSTLVVADLLSGVFSDGNTTVTSYSTETERNYPSALTFIGLAAVAVAVPVKIGFSKKIKNVVTDYNSQKSTGYNNPKLDVITNSNGIGLRFTLN